RNFQRTRRITSLFGAGSWGDKLVAELENPGSRGWDADEWPEFLCFECDNNMCIRETQAEIALELLQSTENRLMQFNMGEGKTKVIMPIMLAAASRGCGQALARATVLSALFSTNLSDWQHKIGGILDRQIVPLLFRRDRTLSDVQLKGLSEDLRIHRARGNIVATTPEHRLSLETKALEQLTSFAKSK
ncbi:unnamed protein product, partial [Amoebophrya sp. A25]